MSSINISMLSYPFPIVNVSPFLIRYLFLSSRIPVEIYPKSYK